MPVVAVNTWFKVGSGDELVGRTGFAHLFEHIMFMGSENVPVGKFDRVARGSRRQQQRLDERRPDELLRVAAVECAAARALARRRPHGPAAADDGPAEARCAAGRREERAPPELRQRAVRARRTRRSSPRCTRRRTRTRIRRIGSMTDLSAASLEDVKNFFRTYYAPNNATLSIVGDFQRDSVKKLVQLYFGGIPRGPALPPRPQITSQPVPRDTFLVLEDKVQLPRLYYAWRTVKAFHEDDAALDFVAYVLAGDKNSRLYKRLVYDMQVAQDVSAFQQRSAARRRVPDHRDAEARSHAGRDGEARERGDPEAHDRGRDRARARARPEHDARAVPRSYRERSRQGRSAQLLQLLRRQRRTTRDRMPRDMTR